MVPGLWILQISAPLMVCVAFVYSVEDGVSINTKFQESGKNTENEGDLSHVDLSSGKLRNTPLEGRDAGEGRIERTLNECAEEGHESTRVLKCLTKYVKRALKGKTSWFKGAVEVDLKERVGRQEEEESSDWLTDLDQLSKMITVKMKFMPGVFIKLMRRDDGFQVGMEIDQENIKKLEGRGGNRKKLKKLEKFLPLLLIPAALQFLLLPMVLSGLKMMATKALLAGKLALLLVIFNAAWMALVPQQAEYNTRVASDHYGYDGGVEYGAFVNSRSERDLAYRGHR